MLQKLQNDTLQQFFENFIDGLKNENQNRKYEELTEWNIPFLVSIVYQSFQNETDVYKEFIADLQAYPEYHINFSDTAIGDDYALIDAEIILAKYDAKEEHMIYPEFAYKMCFEEEERLYGYCECTPDMPDYRADKQCCGHGCDASFCEFTLYKIRNIHKASWAGDEHDYWEFEDAFYEKDHALAEKRKQETKEREIQELREAIEIGKKRLAELLKDAGDLE